MAQQPTHPAHDGRRGPSGERGAFANPDVLVASWYVVGRSREVRRGQVLSTDRLRRRIALFRETDGTLHAVDGRCAHLGADLGDGRVVGGRLVCPFHGWCYQPDGACVAAPAEDTVPSRSLRVYPVRERWGLVFVYLGALPAFDVPDLTAKGRYRIVRTPSQQLDCHPHLVLSNALDASHFAVLHGLEFAAPPRLEQPGDHTVTLHAGFVPRGRMLRKVAGADRAPVQMTYSTFGASLAWFTMHRPYSFHVLFTGLPTEQGGCATQTVLFLPRHPAHAVRALAIAWSIVAQDRKLLERLQFHPGFTQTDTGLRAYAALIERLPRA